MTLNRHKSGIAALLIVAGIAVTTAIAHMSCIVIGPNCFRAQLAPEIIVKSAVEGTWIAPIGTLFVSVLFLVCAIYAVSATKLIKPVPMLRAGIFVISGLCLLRGIATIPIVVLYPNIITTFAIVAGFVWFASGVLCLIGYILLRDD